VAEKSQMTPCEYCGAPGYLIPAAPDYPRAIDRRDSPRLRMPRGSACAEHEQLVRLRLERIHGPERFARDRR